MFLTILIVCIALTLLYPICFITMLSQMIDLLHYLIFSALEML